MKSLTTMAIIFFLVKSLRLTGDFSLVRIAVGELPTAHKPISSNSHEKYSVRTDVPLDSLKQPYLETLKKRTFLVMTR